MSVKKEPVRIKRRYTSLNATRPKDLSIREAQEQVNRYIRSKTTETSRIRDPFLTLGFFFEEAGELARAIINLESEIQEFQRTGFRKSREAKIEMVRDALGDLFYDLCWIASTHKGRSRIRRLSLTEPSERFGLRAARSKSSDIRSLRQYAFKSLGSENLPFVVFPLTRTSQLMGRESESNMRHLLPNAMI